MDVNYLPLFIILAIAWLVPMLTSFLKISKIPTVIVEIIMGILVGPYVMNWVGETAHYLDFLSYMGFLLLIFLSGLSLDVKKILSSFPRGGIQRIDIISNTFLMACFIYFLSLALSLLICYTLPFNENVHPFFMGILLPSVALSIIVPIIKNDGEINGKFGQIILLEGAIATVMTILLVAIYAGFHQNNGFKFEAFLFIIIFIAFFIAYKVGGVMVKTNMFQRLQTKLEHAASQIRIRGSIAILFLFIVIAKFINTEPVLGAFFAGTLIAIFLPKERSALLFKLDGMSYGFFIPIFFIVVGVKLDIGALENFDNSAPFIAIVLLAFYVIQVLPTVILTKLFGVKKALSSGVLLTSRLGLTIATTQIGLSLDLISSAENAGIVAAAIMTCILSPALYKWLNNQTNVRNEVYIIGGGSIALALARVLNMHNTSYLVIEKNKERCDYLKSIDINALCSNALDTSIYKKMKIRIVDTIVVLTGNEQKNTHIASTLKKQLDHSKIITLTSNFASDDNPAIRPAADVQYININHVLAAQIEYEITQPGITQTLSSSFGAYLVEEIFVRNENVDKKYIKDISFPQAGSLMVIKRNGEIFIPHGNTYIALEDRITVIGTRKALLDFRKILD